MPKSKWDGKIEAGGSNSRGRTKAEKKFLGWAKKQGYFAFGRGWPDYCLIKIKPNRGGIRYDKLQRNHIREILLVEVKKKGGKLSRGQQAMRIVLEKARLTFCVSDGGQPPQQCRPGHIP